MNCLEFLDRLDEVLAGTCTPEQRRDVERHGAECRACRELLADVRRVELGVAIEEAQPLDAVEAEELTAAVLRRTAGSPCARAQELLAESLFEASQEACGTPDPILAQHLEHCSACTAVAEAMAFAARTLPSLAELEPDPWFVRAVVARTSRARRAERLSGLLGLWRRWMARPRFAFELAYVATLLLVIIVGNPAETLQAASRRTATVAAASLEKAKSAWPSASAAGVAAVPGRAMNDIRGEMAVRQSAFRAGFERAWAQASETWLSTIAWLGNTASNLVAAASDLWHRVTERGAAPAEPPARPAR